MKIAFIIISLISFATAAHASDPKPVGAPLAQVLYRHPTKRAKDYKAFFIERVKVTPNAKNNVLSTDELKIISDAFTDSARESLANNTKGLKLAEKPTSGVLVVRMEVSEFDPVKPEATGQGDVHIHFDGQGRGGRLLLTGIDGGTQEKIVVLQEDLIGPKYLLGDQKTRLMNMLDAFRLWGSLLQMRLAELKNETKSK